MAGKRTTHCPSCGAPKNAENFGTRLVDGKEYFTAQCRACLKTRLEKYRLGNPEATLWSSCKNRARTLGLAFSLSVSDIVIPAACPVLGIPLVWEREKRTNATPSVDRIDNERGYEPGNVAVISWRANRLKSNATLEELEAITAYLRSHVYGNTHHDAQGLRGGSDCARLCGGPEPSRGDA